jgi:hypothetical protein
MKSKLNPVAIFVVSFVALIRETWLYSSTHFKRKYKKLQSRKLSLLSYSKKNISIGKIKGNEKERGN